MSSGKSFFIVPRTDAGRNGFNSPDALLDNEVCDAVNVYWGAADFGQKRGGANAISMANASFTGVVSSLGVHIPGTDPTTAELWGFDDLHNPGRLAAGNWSTPTFKDAETGDGSADFQSLDGKLFIAYKSGVNRLHVWDGSTVRRTGLAAASAAPTVDEQGSGSYPATLRYYRVRFVQQASGVNVRTSEPSPSQAFTPNGTSTYTRTTRPTAPDEGETHWIIEASEDDATYYQLSTIALATTTYDDDQLPSNYSTLGTLSPTVGSYTLQKSYRFIAADQNRLLGFSSYDTSDPQNRIEFSDIVGGSVLGAAEISPSGNNYVNLNERAAGAITGAAGPIDGVFLAFLYSQVWKLVPTGNPTIPYQPVCINPTIGAVGNEAIVTAEDEAGNPCVYWMSERGVHRWGGTTVTYIGNGVQDLIEGPTAVMNTSATRRICHAIYHGDKRQIWFYIAVGSENEPTTTKLVYHIGRAVGPSVSDRGYPSRWSRDTGASCHARASVMFANTVGATVSRHRKPHVAYANANTQIWKADTADVNDGGTAFRSYITSKVMAPTGPQNDFEVGLSFVQTKTANSVTLQETMVGNFGLDNYTQNRTANLTAENSETRVFRAFDGIGRAGLKTVQFTWGDAAASNNTWFIDKVVFESSNDGVH